MTKYHFLPVEKLLDLFHSGKNGLPAHQIESARKKFGYNSLKEGPGKTISQMLWNQFVDFMILLLLTAAVISFFIGDKIDAFIILAIVIANSILGFYQEYKAEKAMASLKKMGQGNTTVIRDSRTLSLPISDLLPGDMVLLEMGNIIPADIRLIESHNFKTDEATLTGESNPVEKNEKAVISADIPVNEQCNMAFKGTVAVKGRAKGLVVATGMDTELGKIASLLGHEEARTPLQQRMTDFGKKLSVIILFICLIIFITGYLRGSNFFEMLLTSISLAVAAIPEAMPAMISITLAIGARRMVKKRALIRNLPAVETLGSVTYICSDKTGTLTRNKMAVQEIFDGHSLYQTFNIQPEQFFNKNIMLMYNMALNNEVISDGKKSKIGDPTEIALVDFSDNCKCNKKDLESKIPRIGEIPFEPEKKCMTTIHSDGNQLFMFTKGATDTLLDMCNLDTLTRNYWLSKTDEMAEKGLRVIAFACKILHKDVYHDNWEDEENNLTMLGLAGLMDPPRREVKKAIRECKTAGITPVMITGDHILTAKAIAKDLKILETENDILVSGEELQNMPAEIFHENIKNIKVYARVSPAQKLQIVKALQDKQEYVAMTGDGINDAPSLKKANVGLSMGITGTDVSKEASDIILLDDNFSTIVSAIKQGRKIYDNIRKFIRFILTGNTGEIWTIFLAPLLGMPIPLLPIHILWVNLVTDGLPGLALATEKPEKDIMERPPRNPNESVFADGLGYHVLWVGLLIGMICLIMQFVTLSNQMAHWQTMVFTTLSFCQLAHAFAIRSERAFLFRLGIFGNTQLIYAVLLSFALQIAIIYLPFLNKAFRTTPLSFSELMITIGAAMIVFHAVEFEKFIRSRYKQKPDTRRIHYDTHRESLLTK